jgi:hypothetical protein
MDEILQDISKAVAAIGRIDGAPTLLAVLCETTGMRFAAVVRVTEKAGPYARSKMISNWESRSAHPSP